MTPERFRACISFLGYSLNDIGRLSPTHSSETIRKMAKGKLEIKQDMAEWLEKEVIHRTDNPIP